MKNILRFLLVFLLCLPADNLFSWGFYAHQRINRMAVFTLPPDLIGFYKKHIEFVTEHAVDPDKRRYAVEDEAGRHYIDLDRYGDNPFDSIPRDWKKAVEKFGEDTLKAHGIVPWHIDKMVYRLTLAFKEENIDKILRYSSDLGHYIGDSHVPLHTTRNYNGQLTGQKGIHGFWESRIPELYAENYDYFVGRAKYVDKPLDFAWETVKESFAAKDSVLLFEKMLSNRFELDKKYGYENRGNQTIKVYSAEYTAEYNKMLNGMVERRMRDAIIAVGSLWYTAWVNAGQPNLIKLESKEMSDSLKQAMKAEEEMWKTGKIKNVAGHED